MQVEGGQQQQRLKTVVAVQRNMICSRVCCLHRGCCNTATRRAFVCSSLLPFLAYFTLILGAALTLTNVPVVAQFFEKTNPIDFWSVVLSLGFFSVVFLFNVAAYVSLKRHQWGACPTMYAILSIFLCIVCGCMFFLQLNILYSFPVFENYIHYLLTYLQQTCCLDYTGGRICYPFDQACASVAQGTNSTFQDTLQQEMSNYSLVKLTSIVGGTALVALLLLTVGVSGARLGCMITYGADLVDENENEDVVQGEVVYVIDAFVDKRGKKMGQPIVFAGNTFYNIDTWPRKVDKISLQTDMYQ